MYTPLTITITLVTLVIAVLVYAGLRLNHGSVSFSGLQALLILLTGLVLLAVTGCSGSPVAPGEPNLPAMRRWAALHAHQSCVLINGRLTLVTIGAEAGAPMYNISACNPAE